MLINTFFQDMKNGCIFEQFEGEKFGMEPVTIPRIQILACEPKISNQNSGFQHLPTLFKVQELTTCSNRHSIPRPPTPAAPFESSPPSPSAAAVVASAPRRSGSPRVRRRVSPCPWGPCPCPPCAERSCAPMSPKTWAQAAKNVAKTWRLWMKKE